MAVIDFEASSLGDERSYPIEVGLAIADAIDAPVRTWSCLIKPTATWTAGRDWSVQAQRVHGIAPGDLLAGRTPSQVIVALGDLTAGIDHVWCDGGDYDQHWLRRLYDAAATKQPFGLLDLNEADPAIGKLARASAADAPAHRAGPDAARICHSILGALQSLQRPAASLKHSCAVDFMPST